MPITLSQDRTLSTGATRRVRINYTIDLDSGVSLTGTPTVVEVTTSDLTLDDKIVNTSTYIDRATGKTVEVGKAVTFTVAGGVANTTYRIRVTVETDSLPAETLVYDVLLSWE